MDGIDEALAQAGLDLLRLDPGLLVYDGLVPKDSPLPYVLVYTTVTWPADGAGNALTQDRSTAVVNWVVHCAAESADGCRVVQQRVRFAWLDKTVAVLNRGAGRIKQDDVQAPVPDQTTGRLLMDLISSYSLISPP